MASSAVDWLTRSSTAAEAPPSTRAETALRAAPWIAVAVMGVFTLANIAPVVFGVDAWRHDEFYYPDLRPPYAEFVKREGRWLEWIVSGLLPLVPGRIWWIAGYACFAAFCYLAAERAAKDRLYAAAAALLLAQSPAFFSQSFWPAASAPGLILLAALALASRRAPPALLFPVAAVALYGTIPISYFLLPLLYLDRTASARRPLVSAAAMLAIWAGSFVLGYLVAATVNLAAFGRFGFEIAAWRQPNYVLGLGDLIENLQSRIAAFRSLGGVLLGSPLLWAAALAALALRLHREEPRAAGAIIATGLACMLAQFVITLPIGIAIQIRSVVPLGLGALAAAFLQAPGAPRRRALLCALMLPAFFASWLPSGAMIRYFTGVMRVYRDELVRVVPRPPETYHGIVVLDGDVAALETAIREGFGLERTADEWLAESFRWAPAAYAAGFRRVQLCEWEAPVCATIARETLADCSGAQGFYCVRGVTDQDDLIVSFTDPRRPR